MLGTNPSPPEGIPQFPPPRLRKHTPQEVLVGPPVLEHQQQRKREHARRVLGSQLGRRAFPMRLFPRLHTELRQGGRAVVGAQAAIEGRFGGITDERISRREPLIDRALAMSLKGGVGQDDVPAFLAMTEDGQQEQRLHRGREEGVIQGGNHFRWRSCRARISSPTMSLISV